MCVRDPPPLLSRTLAADYSLEENAAVFRHCMNEASLLDLLILPCVVLGEDYLYGMDTVNGLYT